LLQLDPDTLAPIGPPLVAPFFWLSSLVGNGRGDLVAVSGWNGFTRVFDTATGTQLGRPMGGNLNLNFNFARDGTTLLVQEDDHIAIWNYDRTTWPDVACQLAGRNLTREEWQDIGPRTLEYRATCPQFPADTE